MKSLLSSLRSRWYIVVGVLVLIALFVFLRSRSQTKDLYAYQAPTREDIAQTLEVTANVRAARYADLKFLGGGKITALGAKEGDAVKRSQRIATIDVSDLQKSLQKSLNDYTANRIDFEQAQLDRKDTALTDQLENLAQKQQLSLNNSVIGVELQSIAVKNASLISPVDGVLIRSPATVVGQYVTAADVFQVVDPSSLEFVGEIDETDIGKVRTGMEVQVQLDAYPEENVTTTVGAIAYVASVSTQASGGTVFLVHAPIPNADLNKYRLGLSGTMKLILNKKSNALTIPIDATTQHDGKTFAFIRNPADANKPLEKEIQTGIESDTKIEVASGLSMSDEVAISK